MPYALSLPMPTAPQPEPQDTSTPEPQVTIDSTAPLSQPNFVHAPEQVYFAPGGGYQLYNPTSSSYVTIPQDKIQILQGSSGPTYSVSPETVQQLFAPLSQTAQPSDTASPTPTAPATSVVNVRYDENGNPRYYTTVGSGSYDYEGNQSFNTIEIPASAVTSETVNAPYDAEFGSGGSYQQYVVPSSVYQKAIEDYNKAWTPPAPVAGYTRPQEVTQSAVFQDVNPFSFGQLERIYDSINSGAYKVAPDKSALITPYGNFKLESLGNNLYDIPIGARSGSYRVAIGITDDNKAIFNKDFIDNKAIRYVGGAPGGALTELVRDNSILAPVLTVASIFQPELAPLAAAANTAVAVANNNALGALASLTGIPAVAEMAPAQAVSAIRTANTVNNFAKAAETGNTLGMLSSGATLTGYGSTPINDKGLTVADTLRAANLTKAIQSGNEMAIANAAALFANSKTVKDAAKSMVTADATAPGLDNIQQAIYQVARGAGVSDQEALDIAKARSGIQLAEGATGTTSDQPLRLDVSGTPIFAEDQRAQTVKSPFGYTLLSIDQAEDKPAGSYYDITQNAWFTPTDDAETLISQLRDKWGGTGTVPVAGPGSSGWGSDLGQESVSFGGQDVGLGGLPSSGGGAGGQYVGPGNLSGFSGQGPGTGGLPEAEGTLPEVKVVAEPDDPYYPETEPPIVEEPEVPFWPETEPPPIGGGGGGKGGGGGGGGGGSRTPVKQVVQQAALPKWEPPGFIPVKDPFLKIGPTKAKALEEKRLQQLFEALTPELKQELIDREIVPREALVDVKESANGGSIDGISPELFNVMMSRMGYATGGTTTSPFTSDLQKSIDELQPKFVKTTPNFLQPKGQTKGLQLSALTQLSKAQKLGAMAKGGLPTKYEESAPKGHKPEFITGLTGYYAGGRGTGQSDDIPAMLHDGDYVIDAEAVSAFGDGSSKAGKDVLSQFLSQVPHKDKADGNPVPAKIADGEFVLPASFVTALGGGDNKRGAQMLDDMRKKLREHKRSAPLSKIPPKAKSPLDYLKGVKG